MLFRIAFGLFCLVGKVLGQMLLPQPGSMSIRKAAVKCSKRHVTVRAILVHILTYVLKSSCDVRILFKKSATPPLVFGTSAMRKEADGSQMLTAVKAI